jgi:hypothetical protein
LKDLRCRVEDQGFGVKGLRFRVQGSRFGKRV